MPEGDTVWRTARQLDRQLSGQVLTRTDFRVPELATLDLAGHSIAVTVSRGKHLLTRIGEDLTLHTHLKMEGSWHLYRLSPSTSWRRPAYEARVVLGTEAWSAVGFALGVVEVWPRPEELDRLAHLGPDVLGTDWDAQAAAGRLVLDPVTGKPTDRGIGEALIDQRCLAGLGTIYRAETLFLSGINPHRPAVAVEDRVALVERARRLMRANLERPGIVTTGDTRHGRELWVYGRGGRPCRRCGTTIERDLIGSPPYDRVVYWCPRCQT
ncbi:MAG: Fpg/Nei family DNA glycosylase [Nocardioidaceae bacterium]|nr:MAG: Fpg/Nei family DNA glycosylase [Nocardioidaceae bacterium]